MKHTIYFTDKAVIFTSDEDEARREECHLLSPDVEQLRSKVLNLLETYNTISIFSLDSDAMFRQFVAQFAYVEAAGGVVTDSEGRWLMMSRRDRWDFPKGHVEQGETFEQTAVREIEEETGVRGVIRRKLCETWHAYYFEPNRRWEVKRTYWYHLDVESAPELKPQTEEDITRVVWCSAEEVRKNLRNTFPTIRCVADAMGK